LSKNTQFVKSSFTEESLPVDSHDEAPALEDNFELMDLGAKSSGVRREFSYESETARNFDENSIKKAKIGVKELIADAIEKAKSQVQDIKSKAHKEGFDAGFLEGLEKAEIAAREDFNPFLDSLKNSIEQLSVFRTKMYGKAEREMIELVLALSKRIIHFELSTNANSVQSMIQLGVQSVLDREYLNIKIHPEDKGYAESFRPELHHMFQDIKNISLIAHPGVKRGGCIVESNFGTIDSQIDKLEEQIDKILKMTPPEFEDNLSTEPPVAEGEVETKGAAPEDSIETEDTENPPIN